MHSRLHNQRESGKTPSSPHARESGGTRLRFTFLAALAAAFLLVPAAQAAAFTGTVNLAGTGSGEVSSVGGTVDFSGGGGGVEPAEGEPPIECSGPPESGTCTNELDEGLIFGALPTPVLGLTAIPDPGSAVAEWSVEVGEPNPEVAETCQPGETSCELIGLNEAFEATDITVTVTFEALPGFPLNLTTSGTGTGSFECDTGSGPEACEAAYEEGTEVEVIPVPGSGSEFVEWSGDCSGSGACEVTMSEERSVDAQFDAIPRSLTVNTGGTGSGTVQCDTGSGPEVCAASYPHGTEVTLSATPDVGSEFVEWSGDCAGATCELAMDADKTVEATFDLVDWTLSIDTEAGSGAGTVQCDTGSGPEACEATYPHGTVVTAIATPDAENEFTEWSGDCDNAVGNECEVEMDADKLISAVFTAEGLVLLSLIKGGYAEGGTVTSSPAGIDCGTACAVETGEYASGETVELTAVAAEGFVFAGWLGCKFISATPEEGVCEVTVEGPLTEVTAVFIQDGVEGPQGPPGEDGEDGATGPAGPTGPSGEDGATGPQGPDGQDGSNGQNGSNGSDGAAGPPGLPGAPGPQGALGPRGPAGKVKVTCKVKQKGKKVKVTCKVQQAKNNKRANRRHRVRWALMQGGKAQLQGKTTVRRLQRIVNRRLSDGRYVLRIEGQRGGTGIVVR